MIELTSTKRTIKSAELNVCSLCQNEITTATCSVTDCIQTETGWEETPPRYGCSKHPVISITYFLNGTSMPTDEAMKLYDN